MIEPQRIPRRRIDKLRPRQPENRIRTWIAEVPLELLARDLHLQSLWRRALIPNRPPQALRADRHPRIDERNPCQRNQLPFERKSRAITRSLPAANHRAKKKNMSKKKERSQRDQVPPHQPVNGNAVQRAIRRHPPHAIYSES